MTTPAPDARPAAGEDADALVRRLPGVVRLDLDLVEAVALTPRMRRLRWRGEGVDTLSPKPGQDLMVAVPADGQAHFRRRYTIRHHDAAASHVDLDVLVHGDGPGARWAAGAQPGDHVEAIGPRGKIFLAEGADWHLFCADESGVPGAFAMMEALAPSSVALAVLEVADEAEEQPLDARCDARVAWVHGAGDHADATALIDALERVELPPGRGHAYLAGELRLVAAAREALLALGMDAGDIDHKAYWRRGVSNAAHGEPERTD